MNNEGKLNLATFVSNFGDGMHTLAIGQVLYTRTGSVASFGVIITINYLLGLACQVFAGHWADRFNRKVVALISDLARGVLTILLALLVFSSSGPVAIVGVSVLIKVWTHIYRPAAFAIISEAVQQDRLAAFNATNVTYLQGGQLAGMSAFGLFFSLGPTTIFLVDATTFFVSAWLTTHTHCNPVAGPAARASVAQSWREAYGAIRADRDLLLMIVLSASIFLTYQIEATAIVPIVDMRFGGDKNWLSILQGSFSAGCVAALPVLRLFKSERLIPYWMMLQSLAVAVLAFPVNEALVAVAVFVVMGVSSSLATVQLLSQIMQRTPKALHGRISAFRLLCISILVSSFVPPLTATLVQSLSGGILASACVLGAFALLSFLVLSPSGSDRCGPLLQDK